MKVGVAVNVPVVVSEEGEIVVTPFWHTVTAQFFLKLVFKYKCSSGFHEREYSRVSRYLDITDWVKNSDNKPIDPSEPSDKPFHIGTADAGFALPDMRGMFARFLSGINICLELLLKCQQVSLNKTEQDDLRWRFFVPELESVSVESFCDVDFSLQNIDPDIFLPEEERNAFWHELCVLSQNIKTLVGDESHRLSDSYLIKLRNRFMRVPLVDKNLDDGHMPLASITWFENSLEFKAYFSLWKFDDDDNKPQAEARENQHQEEKNEENEDDSAAKTSAKKRKREEHETLEECDASEHSGVEENVDEKDEIEEDEDWQPATQAPTPAKRAKLDDGNDEE